MPYSLVIDTEFAPATPYGGTSSAIDTTGADLLVFLVSCHIGTPTVSDSKGNTWNALTRSGTGNTAAQIFYAKNPTVGTGHTFTISGTEIYPSVYVQAFSGADLTDPFDQESGAVANSVATIQPGAITPSANDALLVTLVSHERASASINSGFTESGDIGIGGNIIAGAAAYLIQTSAASVNPTWTIPSSATDGIATRMASFLAAGGGGGAVVPVLDQGMLTGGLSTLCGGLA